MPSARSFVAALALLALAAACADQPAEPAETALASDGLPAFAAAEFSSWSTPDNMQSLDGIDEDFNTEFLDGCPFISPDGKSFFMASNRTGSMGLDIWVSTRASRTDPWGKPTRLPEPINSEFNDFCPTLGPDGHTFYFVSNRPGCGLGDIYVTRFRGNDRIDEPVNLGCDVNSKGDEASPFELNESGSGRVLYFSSNRAGGLTAEAPGEEIGDSDIYVSHWHGGKFGPRQLVPGVNSAAQDGHPNAGSGGLELVFFSTRDGTVGMQDLYVSTRSHSNRTWSEPVNLGADINSTVGDTRPSLSRDGTTLYFGSPRLGSEGSSDIWVSTRTRE